MRISASDYEKLGQFYIGRGYDPVLKELQDDLILYDSKDLVTHGVVLGMTGSGKTGLCLALLEEAAMDHIPAIVIDPKGDISNLLLTFPDLDADSFRPWINEDDAAKKGVTPDEYAASTAALWKKGLEDWGQDSARIQTLRSHVDVNVFTPGSSAGIPVSILSSLASPPPEVMEDAELLAERIGGTTASLLSLIGVNAETLNSPESALLATLFRQAWEDGRSLDLEGLIREIQSPAFDRVGVIALEEFMPEKSRRALALKFNNLIASPGFSTWLEGCPLDIAGMLHTPEGKPRISIFSIAHLSDAERMFFVSLLLNQMLGWMRTQNGTTSLRAILYMDEIFGYLPPTANPPSKRPMMTLLKQARAFGLGCLLATQNPVDLDYKALSNIGTWFLGRLQTERDKLRVLDGLEGASGAQNAPFNRKEMERLISGLGNRVFLMNNVHENHPVVFHVRWVMSYLTGPLTRAQIKQLMAPKKETFAAEEQRSEAAVREVATAVVDHRPLEEGIPQCFAKAPGASAAVYRPFLYRRGTVGFSSASWGIDGVRQIRWVHSLGERALDYGECYPPPLREISDKAPTAGAAFVELPDYAKKPESFRRIEKDFFELLAKEREEVFSYPALKMTSHFGESQSDFKLRVAQRLREKRDEQIAKIREKFSQKMQTLQKRAASAESQLAKEKSEANAAKMRAGATLLGGILGTVMGRKVGAGTIQKGTTSFNQAGRAYKQHQDAVRAGEKVEDIRAQLEKLESEMKQETEAFEVSVSPDSLTLESKWLKPTTSGIKIDFVGLLWVQEEGQAVV